MTFTADKIRNILLAGHGGSGKTALAEAMLFKSGATERMGSTNEGSTVSDFDPEEIRRKISINTSLAATVWQDTRINIIDAPGQFDFIGGMYEGIRAAESVVITVNGKDGVCPGTIKAYNLAAGQNKARMLAVTCMEVENSDFYKVHTQLKTVFGPSVCPIVVPYDKNGPVEAYINLLTMKAYKYDSKGVPTEVPMPASENRIAGLRASMAEAVAETNEEFMEKFFSGEDFTHDELVKGIHDGVASGAITPLVCCANDTLSGVDMLLDAVVSMLPSPNERKLETLDGVTLDYDENKPLKAFVFKTVADPFVGKISMLKIVQGKLTAGVSAVNATTGETVRIGKLLKLTGKKQEEISEALAGDIAAVTKLEASTNDTLCAPEAVAALAPTEFPQACYFRAVNLAGGGDEGKLSGAIRRLLEEDPTLKYVHNHETHQRMIGGLGDQHLDVAAAKLKSKFGMEVKMSEPKIAYREAIRKPVTIESKYKKQSGGRGQFGDCWIEMEGLPRGSGYVFEDAIVGGAIPRNYIPAIDKGVQEAAARGFLAGCQVVDFRVKVYDGSYHTVDSSEMAFKVAGSLAFKKAMEGLKPVLLEPIVLLTVSIPDESMGDVIGDLSSRRGKVLGSDSQAGITEIKAHVPMSEVLRYAPDLRSMTGGQGFFTMEFDHYEEAPQPVAEKVIAEHQAAKAAE